MVALSPTDKSRTRFHLGFGNVQGIPAGDVARLEEAMNTIYDNYQEMRIIQILDRCDEAWELTQAGADGDYLTREIYSGDINRANVRSEPGRSWKTWWENYLRQTDLLAQQLWVPNYNREEQMRYRFERSGGEYINVVPGVADTSVASRIHTIQLFAGSFGF